eukprot:scaffold4674_cov188-Amphora_coffeaeformis.AAC.6
MLIPFTRGEVLVQFTLLMTSLANGFSSSSSSSSSNPQLRQHSCAVVGVGVLGTSLCRQILETTTDWTVTGITKTTKRHDAIRQAMPADQVHRLTLLTTTTTTSDDDDDATTTTTQKFPNVVFCAPPSGSEDYAADVQDAVENLWMGPEGGGFVVPHDHTILLHHQVEEEDWSSSLVAAVETIYSVESGIVTETTPITNVSPRSEKLVKAEEIVTQAGGCALRLAGLYLLERGAHSYWLGAGKDKPIQGNPDGLINLLHYDDAAGACWAALRAGSDACRGQIFLISDGHPQTRRQIVQAALKSAPYRDSSIVPTFASEQQPDPTEPGKRYDGSWSNQVLQWKPIYESFDKFMEANA